ncbi:MAG: hypothetical protein NTY04_02405 [Candidatus Staskawiczbacteria bacterium]|nr:hypothetical protein [Candidatus Staskawiczbacteria bacterium]
MTEKQNTVIPLTDKAATAIYNLTKKYNIQESEEEVAKKIKGNILFNSSIIVKSIRDFMTGLITENNLVVSFQKDLGISQENSEKLSQDVINKIVPMLKKFPEEELIKRKSPGLDITEKTIKQPAANNYIKPVAQQEKAFTMTDAPTKKTEKKVAKKSIKEFDQTKIADQVIKKPDSKGPDSYRESIE